MNRKRFYPELDWDELDQEESLIKDAAVEMFLKSLELIGTFHPELNSAHLLEVERKMAVTKKRSFERWVEKSFRRRFKQEARERQRFARERFCRSWIEWLSNETTHQAVVPLFTVVVLAGFGGWSLGIANNSCTPFVMPAEQTGVM